jgi:hypothetical protein
MAARYKAWTFFTRSNTGVVDSIPIRGMDICMRLICFCVLVASLRRADPPSKESYRLCKRLRNWKGGQGLTKGCRAPDEWMNSIELRTAR